MSRRNTRAPREILIQEDYLGDFEDVSAYLNAKDPTKYIRKQRHEEKGAKKKGSMRGRDYGVPDTDPFPMKKIRGKIPDIKG